MAKKDIKTIIVERGGATVVAKALTERSGVRVPTTTVHAWWRKNKVPAWRVQGLMALPRMPKQEQRRGA